MKRSQLDRIDRNILKNLQENGRISNVDLAKSVGISAPPCLRRVKILKNLGYIRNYYAEIDPQKLGYDVSGFVSVKLEDNSEKALQKFEKHVSDLVAVRECHVVDGKFDLLLKVVSRSVEEYKAFVSNKLESYANVEYVENCLSIRPSKSLNGVPIE